MKKVLFFTLAIQLIGLLSCKNTNIYTPVSPVVHVQPVINNPDAPPPGTPVLETPQAYNNYIVVRQHKIEEAILRATNNVIAKPEAVSNITNETVSEIN